METLQCPGCGSNNLNQMRSAEYKCSQCGISFILTNTQTGFVDVVLVEAGKKKTKVILALREVTTREPTIEIIELAMAKNLTDTTPCVVIPNLPLEVGERVKERLEKAGATVDLKPA